MTRLEFLALLGDADAIEALDRLKRRRGLCLLPCADAEAWEALTNRPQRYGYGHVSGYGDGDCSGSGEGSGYGYGDGSGSGSGDGYGSGYGDGYGDGQGAPPWYRLRLESL